MTARGARPAAYARCSACTSTDAAAALVPVTIRGWNAARVIQRATRLFLYDPEHGVTMKRAKRSFEATRGGTVDPDDPCGRPHAARAPTRAHHA